MINPHETLLATFSNLPNALGKKVHYRWGDEYELNKLIKLYQNGGESPYPMIYNVSNTYSLSKKGYIEYNPISLVIMTRNENKDWHNGNRWKTSYQTVLFPVLNNIIEIFKKSNVFSAFDVEQAKVSEFPDYGNGRESELTDIVDALRLDARVVITDNCYIPFPFSQI